MPVATEEKSEQFNFVEHLDELSDTDRALWTAKRAEILNLSPSAIAARYGTDVLVWAAANVDEEREARRIIDTLVDLADYDGVALLKAIRWSKKRHKSSKGTLVIAGYELADRVLNRPFPIDLEGLLRGSAAPGVELSNKRIGEYSLRAVQAGGLRTAGFIPETYAPIEDNTFYNATVDGPLGFLLFWKQRPQAVVGIGACSASEIMIYQMQGIVGKLHQSATAGSPILKTIGARGLAPLVWRKFLIDLIEAVGSRIEGFRSIAIQEGAQNTWIEYIPPDESAPHLSLEAAQRAYDIPAEEAGFLRGDDGNWHRQIRDIGCHPIAPG